jgi:uncharacterized protein YutD
MTKTDSYVALQELPARRVITSMTESSENDVVITVEKDWFIRFQGIKHSVSELWTRLSSGLPRCAFWVGDWGRYQLTLLWAYRTMNHKRSITMCGM